MSFIIGLGESQCRSGRMRVPTAIRNEPPPVPIPRQATTVQPATRPPALLRSCTRRLRRHAGQQLTALRLRRCRQASAPCCSQIDGTQVDFTKTDWRDDAETVIDGLVVDLTSDAGQGIRISIEAHTDNVGSNAANIMLGLDRARAVREYIVTRA